LTEVIIYPLWEINFNFFNLAKYARANSFTVTKIENNVVDIVNKTPTDGGAMYHKVIVSQTLSSGQKTAIQDIFKGMAFVTFV